MLVRHWTLDSPTIDNVFVGPDTLVKAIIDGQEVIERVVAVDTWFGVDYFELGNGVWIDESMIVDSWA